MKRLMFVVSVVVLVLAGCAPRAADKIVVATDATWPPMQFINEQQEIVGFDIDLINAIAEKAGFEVEVRNVAWDGIFAGLINGSYDAVISSVTITEARRQQMDFSEPYINAGQIIVARKGTTKVTMADFAGATMGAQIGTTGAKEIQKHPNITLRTYDEIGLAIKDLALGRIEGVVVDTPTAASFVLRNPEYKGALMIVGEPITEEYYGIAVRKDNRRVLDLINKGLARAKEAGLIKELEKKWLR